MRSYFSAFSVAALAIGSSYATRKLPEGPPEVGGPPPNNLNALECAIHQLAYSYAANRTSTNLNAVFDALNINLLCNTSMADYEVSAPVYRTDARSLHAAPLRSVQANTFYVDGTNGNDNNPGTQGSPFQTLGRAQQATRAIPMPNRQANGASVIIASGTYYLGAKPLALTDADSYVTWTSAPGVFGRCLPFNFKVADSYIITQALR
jgi:hypothetical protein